MPLTTIESVTRRILSSKVLAVLTDPSRPSLFARTVKPSKMDCHVLSPEALLAGGRAIAVVTRDQVVSKFHQNLKSVSEGAFTVIFSWKIEVLKYFRIYLTDRK